MCLIVLAHRHHADYPVVFAANRDEQRGRPTESMQLLSTDQPRIAGGKDLLAGGTWMAINEVGLVVGLTNQAAPARDPKAQSRGQIPLLLATAQNAPASACLAQTLRPDAYNPCALLLADGKHAFYIELQGTGSPEIRELQPGIHILENRPLDARSAKVDRVRARLGSLCDHSESRLRAHLEDVLADRKIPENPTDDRPPELQAARVEFGDYGTRSATLVLGRESKQPAIWHTDSPPGDGPMTERNPFASRA